MAELEGEVAWVVGEGDVKGVDVGVVEDDNLSNITYMHGRDAYVALELNSIPLF